MLPFLIVSAKKRGINAVRLIHGYVGLQKYFSKLPATLPIETVRLILIVVFPCAL